MIAKSVMNLHYFMAKYGKKNGKKIVNLQGFRKVGICSFVGKLENEYLRMLD